MAPLKTYCHYTQLRESVTIPIPYVRALLSMYAHVCRIKGCDTLEAVEFVLRYFRVSNNVVREYRHCTRRGKMEAIVESGDGGW
jgi:hypothetical protein